MENTCQGKIPLQRWQNKFQMCLQNLVTCPLKFQLEKLIITICSYRLHTQPSYLTDLMNKFAVTKPTSRGRSVGIVRLRTKSHGV
jgi:hypothetical protein